MALTKTLQIAFDLLSDQNKAMHVNELAELAVSKNMNMNMNAKELASKLSSALASNLNTAKPLFSKVSNGNGSFKRGVYKLKRQSIKAPTPSVPKFSELSTAYTGKAGEYAVMSELLFWGFNVSLMAVDQGVDIVAAKDNKYFHIQVKATTEKSDSINFCFTVKREVFEANNNSATFYVLVLRSMSKTDFIVLPSNHIDSQIKLGNIKGKDSYNLRVSFNPKTRRYYLNGSQDMTPHHNAFTQIR